MTMQSTFAIFARVQSFEEAVEANGRLSLTDLLTWAREFSLLPTLITAKEFRKQVKDCNIGFSASEVPFSYTLLAVRLHGWGGTLTPSTLIAMADAS